MSANSKIEWTDHTFNPWIGCTKISTATTGGGGCDGCYAYVSTPARVLRSKGAETWGPGAPRVRTSEANWKMPLRWNAQADAFMAQHGRRQRVFCASLADVFDNAVDPQWRVDLFDLIAATPNLDWLLLTKRIGNVGNMLPVPFDFERLYPHVWIGATVVNQAEADRDIPKLLAVPAAKRFLSMEPLLGPVNLTDICDGHADSTIPREYWEDSFDTDASPPAVGHNALTGERWQRFGDWRHHGSRIDWVIVGGESGPEARPMHPDWARSLRDQCAAAGVPFLFKQHGEWREPSPGESFDTSMGRAQRRPAFIMSEAGTVHCFENASIVNGKAVIRIGKKAAGRLLDGREWNEVPA
ncbi:phage Gp37/Gp68 family protein [Variovorax sp. YR752]|uniref:phage Gp37/Gp68 family protein n=1 Tax=Variovorax sp. YR752 TaxID=1884383 RepID=UPI000BE43708|nr:phage Gp37/Gp68 family protein [Variovorax sp. YR752]